MRQCKSGRHEYADGERRCAECAEERIRKWALANKDRMALAQKRYRDSNSKNLKRVAKLYGITAEEYEVMFTEQGGRCAICERHQLEFRRRLCVDHCHKTGKVRGLLCDNCNHGIGLFKDNSERMFRAIKYLSAEAA